MANIVFKRIEDSSLIDNYPVVDGSFIVTKDGYAYIDYGEDRIPVIDRKKPAGIIEMYGGSTAPSGYLLCDGSAVSRTTYPNLFTAIGTNYGSGDGSTTFNLPNLKGKIAVGQDINDTDFDTLGETGGEKTHTLTINEMPRHNHSLIRPRWSTDAGANAVYGSNGEGIGSEYDSRAFSGGDQAHNNLQPYIVTNYIISY